MNNLMNFRRFGQDVFSRELFRIDFFLNLDNERYLKCLLL